MNKLLQEVANFVEFGNCLEPDLFNEYKQYLEEQLLQEFDTPAVAHMFKKVFAKNEIESNGATLNGFRKQLNALQQSKYERSFNKVVPNGRTHLENGPEKYCDKKDFKKAFVRKEDFSEFECKKDLAVEDFTEVLLDEFLKIFDDEGWLISKSDTKDE